MFGKLEKQILELKREMLKQLYDEADRKLSNLYGEVYDVKNFEKNMEKLRKINRLLDGDRYVF